MQKNQSPLRPVEEVCGHDQKAVDEMLKQNGGLPYAFVVTAVVSCEDPNGKGATTVYVPSMPPAPMVYATLYMMHMICERSDSGYDAAMVDLCDEVRGQWGEGPSKKN